MQATIRVLCFSVAVLLSACATTRMDAQWSNPEYKGRSVKGASILVACEAQDLTLQRICEDQLAAAVSAQGAKATLNSQLSPAAGAPAGNDPYMAAAKRVGAQAIVRMTLGAGQPVAVDSGPRIGIGVGGGSGGYGGGRRCRRDRHWLSDWWLPRDPGVWRRDSADRPIERSNDVVRTRQQLDLPGCNRTDHRTRASYGGGVEGSGTAIALH